MNYKYKILRERGKKMQRKRLEVTRLIASMTVLMLLMINILPTFRVISYALDDKEDVEISGFFQVADGEMSSSASLDVNETEAKLVLNAKVNGKGYLKAGVFEIENNASFEVKETSEVEVIDNQIKVKMIDEENPDQIIIPIEFRKKEKYEHDYFNKANRVTFTGTFVNNEGEEQKIQRDLWLDLGWTEDISVKVENEVIKNVEYEQEETTRRIVQSVLKVYDSNVERKLPVKSSYLEIDIPQISEMNLVDAQIDAEKLLFTQGTEDSNVVFGSDNYVLENNVLKVNVPTIEDQMIGIDSFGEDIYVLTLVYEGTSTQAGTIEGKVKTIVEGFTGITEETIGVASYDLSTVTKKMVSYFRENKTDTISLGYLMANTIKNRYEISYNKKDILNITRADLVNYVEIRDEEEYFKTEDGRKYDFSSNYSSLTFNKYELEKVLGSEGKVDVYDQNGNIIISVEAKENPNENGDIVVNFSENVTRVYLRTTTPVEDGNISVIGTKKFEIVDFSKAVVSYFSELVNTSSARAYYKDGNTDELGKISSSITVTPVVSNAILAVSNNKFSTVSSNDGVNFQIYLNNSPDTSDLYENPIFEIKFPKAVTEVEVENVNLFYANNELAISNIEVLEDNEGRKVLRISLSGNQVSYDLNAETNGTVISLDTNIRLDEFTTNIKEDIEMLYANFSATGYTNSTEWRMLSSGKGLNGVYYLPVSYDSPEGLLNAQTTEIEEPVQKEEEETETVEEVIDVEENNEENETLKVISIKQGVQDELLDEGVDAQLATMTISVMNNTSKRYTEFSILGRIPFAGNKDVRTGKDLGTTVDTILDSKIVSTDPSLIYEVFYSENPDATDDLNDEANGWTQNFGKSGTIKSYLIIVAPAYVLEPNETLQFEYDYVIPADLQPGDALYGTYASFYKEIIGDSVQENRESNDSADAVGYRTEQKASVDVDIKLEESASLQEYFDSTFSVTIRNTSDVDARNVYAQINMPEYLRFLNATGADAQAIEKNGKLQLIIPEVKAGQERTVYIKFNVKNVAETKDDKLTVGVFGNNLPEIITKETENYTVYKTDFIVNDQVSTTKATLGVVLTNTYSIYNPSDEDFGTITLTKDVSEVFDIREVTVKIGKEKVEKTIDNDNHKFTITINDFQKSDYVLVEYKLGVNFLEKKQSENTTKIQTKLDIEGRDSVFSEQEITYYEPSITIRTANNNEMGFAEVGETISYEYDIINNSEFDIYTMGLDLSSFGNQELNYITVRTSDEERSYDASLYNAILVKLSARENAKVIINSTIKENDNAVNNQLGIILDGKKLSSAIYETNIEESKPGEGHSIVGMAFIDRNNNNRQDSDEEVLDGIIVNLYDSVTNELIESTITNVGGRYEFKHKDDGRYYVKFDYDESKYRVNTSDQAKVLNIKNKNLTDNINIFGKSISDVNLSLTDENVFDLRLNATVEKITIQNKAENTNITVENNKLAKVDINPDIVEGSKVFIEYKINIKNQGSVAGKVNKIVDYLPSGFDFDTQLNPDWYKESDGNIYTRALVNDYLEPGEERELSLILVRVMDGENTGLAHNCFEIVEATNDKGIKDIDSTPNNKLNEDDLSSADVIIGISTGIILKLIPVIMGGIIVAAMIGVLVWRIIDRRRYV